MRKEKTLERQEETFFSTSYFSGKKTSLGYRTKFLRIFDLLVKMYERVEFSVLGGKPSLYFD